MIMNNYFINHNFNFNRSTEGFKNNYIYFYDIFGRENNKINNRVINGTSERKINIER